MDLEKVFDEVSTQMRSDFEKSRQALHHAGLKGSANEEIVKKFLEHYLPRHLEISSGIVVDSHGRKSRQLDIIIHDAHKTPIFYRSETARVIPVECVYSAVEVKAYLDKGELANAGENMESLKSLTKDPGAFFEPASFFKEAKTLYGSEWEHWPIQHFVFAFESPELESVSPNLFALQGHRAVHQRVDAVCILNKGVLVNQTTSGMFQIIPEPDSQLVASHTKKPLLFFYSLMSILLNQASMKNFNIRPYLRGMAF